jgi:hypothetical protein
MEIVTTSTNIYYKQKKMTHLRINIIIMQLNNVGDPLWFTSHCWPRSANRRGRLERSTWAPEVAVATGEKTGSPFSCYGGAGLFGALPPAKKTTTHEAPCVTVTRRGSEVLTELNTYY